jgi:hypothetical protein
VHGVVLGVGWLDLDELVGGDELDVVFGHLGSPPRRRCAGDDIQALATAPSSVGPMVPT